MMSSLEPLVNYLDQVGIGAWALFCILYLFAALFIRGWFMAPIAAQMKMVEKKNAHKIKSVYLKQAFLGWIFFLFPVALVMAYWTREKLPFPLNGYVLFVTGLSSYILSLLLHLQAFTIAALSALEILESNKTDI